MRNKQIPRPRHWQEFEDLCLSLFKSIWNNPLAQKNGRSGQPQCGVDIWGAVNDEQSRIRGIQCKGKDASIASKVTQTDLREEIAKAEKFAPPLEHWILATTAPPDAELQRIAREISVERERQGKFTVQVIGWGDIESLLCDHPTVLELHYPELGIDIAILAKKISVLKLIVDQPLVSGASFAQPEAIGSSSHPIVFHQTRDIGPALLGRPLGPSDALACPKLPEVSPTVKQLEMAYSAHLVGDSGSGKSVCAFQVAYAFAEQGWEIFSSSGSDGLPAIPKGKINGRLLLLIDDAHLLSRPELRSLTDLANPRCLILCTHNAIEGLTSQRGAIRMNPQAAIEAISSGLLANRNATLDAVRRADNHVGDTIMDESLEDRIEHAAKYASHPWQFCFVLGGGWRRATEAANIAKAIGASLPLAAIAIRQIASRDARLGLSEIADFLTSAGVEIHALEAQLEALIEERIVLARNDLRCPHQRFAAVLLSKLIGTLHESTISQVEFMLRATLADENISLSGIRALLHELWFADNRRWQNLVTWDALEPVLKRCWTATDPNEISAACYVIHEVLHWSDGAEGAAIRGHESKLVTWLEEAKAPMGHGLSWLLNSLLNIDEPRALSLVRQASPQVIANLISNSDPASVWHIALLAKGLRLWINDPWAQEISHLLNSERLLTLAATWPVNEPLYPVVELLESVIHLNQDLALSIVEELVPEISRRLMEDPVKQFYEISDLFWHVLRVLDLFGTYRGKKGPSKRHIHIARSIFANVDLREIGSKLSRAPLRKFQQVSYLLASIRRVSSSKFQALVGFMDWNQVALTVGDHWKYLPHDAEVLMGIASATTKTRQQISNLIQQNLWKMDQMPPRLAYIAPSCAIEFVRAGRKIAIADSSHVHWKFGAYLISFFAKEAPELVPTIVNQCISTVAKCLSEAHPSWYKNSYILLECMQKFSPTGLQQVFEKMDLERVQVGWKAALAAGGESKKSVLLLILAARDRSDGIGQYARHLKKYSTQKIDVSKADS
ncbi:hypothetical protein [Undibacterium sp.]|uniref:hypothetical protein n=1 Tax=Undibacterium sp. TaxID=1914977 RepID=UPI002730D03C|nr:hypothetical protein [Undibacterium sp.]MDP1979932.1 hypothetical protein [Undibacterium sp.]